MYHSGPDAGHLDADSGSSDDGSSDGDARGDRDESHQRYRAIGVATGESHTCALLDDHNVKCWGTNSYGELGYGDMLERGSTPSQMGDALPVVDLGNGRTATKIAAGRYATCAVLDDGSLKCWGMAGLNGKLVGSIGDQPAEMGDNLTPVNLGGRRVVNVAIGYQEACASMDDYSIWCWGLASLPEIVSGLPKNPVKALSAAAMSVYGLYEDGTVSPLLPSGSAPVFSSSNIVAISGATGGETCAAFDDGTFACLTSFYPNGANGKVTALGAGAVSELLCGLFADGSVRCPPAGETCTSGIYWCDADGTIALGQGATAVTSGGDNFICALLADGAIKCWGGARGTAPPSWLGSGVAVTQSDGGLIYGAWHPVDLGTHP